MMLSNHTNPTPATYWAADAPALTGPPMPSYSEPALPVPTEPGRSTYAVACGVVLAGSNPSSLKLLLRHLATTPAHGLREVDEGEELE
jgi:hypothetical protein